MQDPTATAQSIRKPYHLLLRPVPCNLTDRAHCMTPSAVRCPFAVVTVELLSIFTSGEDIDLDFKTQKRNLPDLDIILASFKSFTINPVILEVSSNV